MRSIRLSPALKSVLCPSRIFTSPSRTATRRHYSTESSKRDKEAVGVFSPKAAALLVVTGLGLLWYFDHEKKKLAEEREKARQNATYGRPDVGGPFELVDQNGKPFTDKDLLGSYSLVYFGFTNCPDICPDELDKMGLAVEAVEKALPADNQLRLVKPVFVSVDPARDSVDQIRHYAKDFHPRLIALTGTHPAVKSMCKAYRVYFSSPPPKEGEPAPEDYLVDHSIYFYLMDPDGKFVQAYGKVNTAEDVTRRVLDEVSKWQQGERAEQRYAHQVKQ